jgi:HEPN domain-containing protein
VDEHKRKMVVGALDKAQVHLETAKKHVEARCQPTEAIQAAQECVEHSVKAVLSILGIEYPRSHGWNQEQLTKIAKQIQDRKLQARLAETGLHIKLPRLLTLANLWDQFYLQAKYGLEAADLAPAQDLFENKEAELAVAHAEECWWAAFHLRNLSDERLAAIIAPGQP